MLRAPHARLAGVLGWPLESTLSPAMHNAAFRAAGVDWVYLAFPVAPDDLRDAVAGLRALGAMGANVTMPHKQRVAGLVDELSGDARTLGAVNTIQRVGDRLVGHNTDVDGFSDFLAGDCGVDGRGRRCVVLGAGGAARAVVRALDELGAEAIVVAARRVTAARAVAEVAQRAGASAIDWGRAEDAAARGDIVVNATPLGASGEDLLPTVAWRREQVVVDLVYQRPATSLVTRARAAGAQGWGGLGMLVRQGAASFRLWTGQDAPAETMSAAALRALRALEHGTRR